MGPTIVLAEFLSKLHYEQLPSDVITKAKECVLDQLGVQLVASRFEWSRIVYSTVKALGGNPECTIVNYGDKTSAPNAAFANGTFGHGCEFDDHGPNFGHGHPGCVVIPGAVAIGEKVHATGKDLITAIVAGYEVQGRISMCCSRSVLKRGFHNPWFIFGPVAAAAKILNLGTDGLVQAFGIAGSFAAGLRQYTKSGGETKRLHAGNAASRGILSVLLAQGGFSAPPDILEGETGFIKAFSDTYSFEPLTRGPSEELLILQTGFKLRPSCGGIHPITDTVLRMVEANKIEPEDIKQVTVHTNTNRIDQIGRIYEPHNALGAQFSLPFSLGIALVKRKLNLDAYMDESLWKDPEVLGFARKVVMEVDPEANMPYVQHRPDLHHKFPGKVVLTLKDGRRLEDTNRPTKGTPPGEPLSWQDVVEKFEENAATVLPSTKVQLLVETVDKLETLGDISELVAHLCA
ncbi:MAG: MmgE/PrpD family protein [Deltaproteobacteria bacterium]|nr:MmgE/PrpD family protein [Deltaproteobacteria bacterium]